MNVLPSSVEKVIDEFSKIPGVGPKSAARMAYHFLRSPKHDGVRLANSLIDMDEKVKSCTKCFNVSDKEVCDICDSQLRDEDKLCIVEEPLDVVAFEKSGIYKGKYFVLGGVISPADGISADELRFKELKTRVNQILEKSDTVELIIATNPSLEGEATAHYISDYFKDLLK
ncbi:MAG TPA: recombination mediator RecR, partial [Candidatus Dojkabacteria bacterium]|nr:recombination mediator RecR [Candidatus Dojkabacteria bacterium]